MSGQDFLSLAAAAARDAGAPLANHLWQSTLFVAVAGLLALLLKANRAQARYWIWFVASVKFLVPFSALIAVGSRLARPASGAPGYLLLIEEIGRPFSAHTAAQPAAPTVFTALLGWLPMLLLAGWLLGCAAVLLFWLRRWRRVMAVLDRAKLLESGREAALLRRLEAGKVRLMVSEAALEPGIVGIFRPVLLLPEGIAARLTDQQLEAVFAHELCHVRRRDNLAAAAHMLVEALFWFHPLVWWLGARLVAERERACDEEVLRRGSPPQAYAEGILKVCEFYLESPLTCVAGVTGSNLKKRIEAIMVHRIARKLHFAKKLLLAAAGTAALALPVVFGLLHPPAGHAQSPDGAPYISDVTMHPAGTAAPGDPVHMRFMQENGIMDVKNVTLEHLLSMAYGVSKFQISGAPEWIATDLLDISAKARDMDSPQFKQALQSLLAERFKLAAHRELKNAPVFELTVAAGGTKLVEAAATGHKTRGMMHHQNGHVEASDIKIDTLVGLLQNHVEHMVVDKTGLKGTYNFTLDTTGLTTVPAHNPAALAALQKALSEQLGLELRPQSGQVDMLVIDHVEKLPGEK